MDDHDRQQILRERLAANRQRLARQAYLEQLPVRLRSYLQPCTVIQTPAIETLVPLFWISADGIGTPPYKPIGYRYTEYNWADQALTAAQVPAAYDQQPSYFWPSRNNPIYEVEFGWVRRHLHELWAYSPRELGIVSTDRSTGLVLSNYSGYLPEDPNPEEVVYELAVWHKDLEQA